MRPATSQGLWIATIGAGLQMVGLAWDAIMHALDPTLVEREDVFTIANPSHLLVMVGLAMTVAGIATLMVTTGWRRTPHNRRRIARVVGGATLLLLFTGMSGLALATGGMAGSHSHAGADVTRAAGGSNVVSSKAFAELEKILRERGMSAALDRLEEIARRDPTVMAVAHDYAHALGKTSLQLYGSASLAFGSCRETFQSGCYHGVLELYLEQNPQLTSDQLADLCDTSIAPNAAYVVRFQCLHGLGHGLTGNLEHDIFKALRMCDYLRSDWDKSSCYGGVFMENIIFATQMIQAGDDGPQHDHGAGHKYHLDPRDPLYPCNVVDERYKSECFIMQTSAILMYNNHDFSAALTECDRAPRNYVHLCYQSIGRDVSAYTLRDPQKSLVMCSNGQAAYRGYCYLGAAKNMIDVTWKIDEALVLCRGTADDYKTLCYQAIGEQLATIHPAPVDRERECARSEPAWISACSTGAGLTRAG